MTLEGYDISHHQTTTPDLASVDFVIVRATYGSNPDDLFAMHAQNARAAGKVVGAYHFARPATLAGQSVDEQVAAFLRTIDGLADFIAVDREADGSNGTISLTDTRTFIGAVHATGRRIGLYASESAFRSLGQDWNWVAHWGQEPAIAYDIWQWDGGGTDKLDNDRFRGTRGALLALGAPLQPWVDSTIAALTTRAVAAETNADNLQVALSAEQQAHKATQDALAAAQGEVDDIAHGLNAVSAWMTRHPVVA